MGTCKILSLNWMVFDHLTPTFAPDELRITSTKMYGMVTFITVRYEKVYFAKESKEANKASAHKEVSNG